ncbi:hypothetical protein ACHAW6_007494 [Cyclotella cf. meneghiniana]
MRSDGAKTRCLQLSKNGRAVANATKMYVFLVEGSLFVDADFFAFDRFGISGMNNLDGDDGHGILCTVFQGTLSFRLW